MRGSILFQAALLAAVAPAAAQEGVADLLRYRFQNRRLVEVGDGAAGATGGKSGKRAAPAK